MKTGGNYLNNSFIQENKNSEDIFLNTLYALFVT